MRQHTCSGSFIVPYVNFYRTKLQSDKIKLRLCNIINVIKKMFINIYYLLHILHYTVSIWSYKYIVNVKWLAGWENIILNPLQNDYPKSNDDNLLINRKPGEKNLRVATFTSISAKCNILAVNLAPSELLYIISNMLNKTSKSTKKLYIFRE
jgi:hypothetical protein